MWSSVQEINDMFKQMKISISTDLSCQSACQMSTKLNVFIQQHMNVKAVSLARQYVHEQCPDHGLICKENCDNGTFFLPFPCKKHYPDKYDDMTVLLSGSWLWRLERGLLEATLLSIHSVISIVFGVKLPSPWWQNLAITSLFTFGSCLSFYGMRGMDNKNTYIDTNKQAFIHIYITGLSRC